MQPGWNKKTAHEAALRLSRKRRTHRGILINHSLDHFRDFEQADIKPNEGGA